VHKFESLPEPFFGKWPLVIPVEQTLSSFKTHLRLCDNKKPEIQRQLVPLEGDFKLHWCSLTGTTRTHFEF
jgi:hypothetical protein